MTKYVKATASVAMVIGILGLAACGPDDKMDSDTAKTQQINNTPPPAAMGRSG